VRRGPCRTPEITLAGPPPGLRSICVDGTIVVPALLVLGDITGAQVVVPLKAMVTVALFELALRRGGC